MAIATYELLVTEDLDRGTGTVSKTSPAGGSLSGTQVGIHSFAVGGQAASATWDPGSVAVGSSTSTTISVPGAALGDFVLRSFSLSVQGLAFTADVTAADTVTVVLSNLTGAAVNLSSGTLRVIVLKSK